MVWPAPDSQVTEVWHITHTHALTYTHTHTHALTAPCVPTDKIKVCIFVDTVSDSRLMFSLKRWHTHTHPSHTRTHTCVPAKSSSLMWEQAGEGTFPTQLISRKSLPAVMSQLLPNQIQPSGGLSTGSVNQSKNKSKHAWGQGPRALGTMWQGSFTVLALTRIDQTHRLTPSTDLSSYLSPVIQATGVWAEDATPTSPTAYWSTAWLTTSLYHCYIQNTFICDLTGDKPVWLLQPQLQWSLVVFSGL